MCSWKLCVLMYFLLRYIINYGTGEKEWLLATIKLSGQWGWKGEKGGGGLLLGFVDKIPPLVKSDYRGNPEQWGFYPDEWCEQFCIK